MPHQDCCKVEPGPEPLCDVNEVGTGKRLQNIADCALTKIVERRFYLAVEKVFRELEKFFADKLCVNIELFYLLLAALAVICWLNRWTKFLICVARQIPCFLRDIACLRFPDCILRNCPKHCKPCVEEEEEEEEEDQ